MNDRVLAEAIGPASGTQLRIKQAVLVVLGIAALAIAAKIKVPMWPVPITMGTFAVLTVGAAYGARLGLVTILGYMIIGALGFDVFAGSSAEKFGLTYMMGRHGRLSCRLCARGTGAWCAGAGRLGPFRRQKWLWHY